MESAEVLHDVLARPEVEVVRVAEDHVRAERANLRGKERLDRPLRPDGHERRRADLAVGGPEDARPCSAVDGLDRKAHPATLENQHGVAERVEAVPLADRDGIELARPLYAREGHHEGEQRRPR